MSRSRYGYNVNASLLREVRMIFQHFFSSRESQAFWNSRKPAAPKSSPPLQCVGCIRERRSVVKNAIAVSQGNSVCEEHAL